MMEEDLPGSQSSHTGVLCRPAAILELLFVYVEEAGCDEGMATYRDNGNAKSNMSSTSCHQRLTARD